MNARVIAASELDDSLRLRWREIQAMRPELANPYFCVEFTEAVATVRRDVFVAVLEHGQRVMGFLPFHRRRGGFARPVGLGLSDYHGVIAAPDIEWTPQALLADCRLTRWRFDHLLATQLQFSAAFEHIEDSPIIDVSGSIEAYERDRIALGGTELRNVQRRRRKLCRELGDYRFIAEDPDTALLERVMQLKSQQCRESGAFDFFSLPWTGELVRLLHQTQTPFFRGALSSIRLGDQCLAAHMGMRSEQIWHWWLPCYEQAFSRYSPGLILLLDLAAHVAQARMRHIDLGKDLSRYKRNLMNGAIQVAAGEVRRPSLLTFALRAAGCIERAERQTLLRPIARLPAGLLRRARRHYRFN